MRKKRKWRCQWYTTHIYECVLFHFRGELEVSNKLKKVTESRYDFGKRIFFALFVVNSKFQNLKPLSDKLKSLYRYGFGFGITNQDVNWVPHIACSSCNTMLMRWKETTTSEHMRFAKPTTNITDLNANISYANVSSVMRLEKNSSREWNCDSRTYGCGTSLREGKEPLEEKSVGDTEDYETCQYFLRFLQNY